jgi:hypothetical protein
MKRTMTIAPTIQMMLFMRCLPPTVRFDNGGMGKSVPTAIVDRIGEVKCRYGMKVVRRPNLGTPPGQAKSGRCA